MPQAKQLVTSLFAAAPAPVALRAAAMLRQQYSTVKMPTPALGGGLGADQLAAYAGDWDAYRLLALLSRLVPAALRPAMPPTFTVAGPRLLRVVEQWAMAGARLPFPTHHPLRLRKSATYQRFVTSVRRVHGLVKINKA